MFLFLYGIWAAVQVVIITAFAAAGLLLGGAINPGSRLTEAAVALPFLAVGFYVARIATRWGLLLGDAAQQIIHRFTRNPL